MMVTIYGFIFTSADTSNRIFSSKKGRGIPMRLGGKWLGCESLHAQNRENNHRRGGRR